METVIDCKRGPQYLIKKEGWKALSQRRRSSNIELKNEQLYERLSITEKTIGRVAADNLRHMKETNLIKSHIDALNGQARIRKLTQIQKENEYFLHRLKTARPDDSIGSVDSWYQSHLKYRVVRLDNSLMGDFYRNSGSISIMVIRQTQFTKFLHIIYFNFI